MNIILFSTLLIFNAMANQINISCEYKIAGVPFSQVSLGFLENGQSEDFVTVSVQGKSHRESYTPAALESGERIHGWISKESSENSIEIVIYQERQKFGVSKLVNHRVPIGKEIWGECNDSSN
ncbi:MAG: hypothetical protein M9962_04965 [Oligoflexia bacterium]|nr:hypothetical protein [Oligoflexia bacterium]